MNKYRLPVLALSALLFTGCATETSRTIETPTVTSAAQPYRGAQTPIAVGKFENRSTYLSGIFSDGVDRIGNQAKTILVGHMQQTGRFRVLERTNMEELKNEAKLSGTTQSLAGAKYVITGDITEFGRKQLGDHQLWGVLGRGKSQVAYAKATLNVVSVITSEVVFSAKGAGEYALSEREVIGFGGNSGYDSTLNGKVLDLAIREAVNNLTAGIDSGAWQPDK